MNLAYVGYNRGLPNDNGTRGDFQPIFDEAGNLASTFCNLFIQYICNGFAYGNFNGMTANDMVKYMQDPVNGWISPADDGTAQSHANSGVIVLAGWSNPDGHGHVNLILPGILEKSGSWARPVPKCANIGRDVFFGKRLSFAFAAQEQPKYYALSGMI